MCLSVRMCVDVRECMGGCTLPHPSGPQTYSLPNLYLCLLPNTRDIPCESHRHANNINAFIFTSP